MLIPSSLLLVIQLFLFSTPISSHSHKGSHHAHSSSGSSSSSSSRQLPLFSGVSSLPTLHTSLSTLLPILPRLAPAPSYTLLVTMATPAFKPLLYNWMCFLRWKAKWGRGTLTEEKEHEKEEPDEVKVLVLTSDETLARELSDLGVVVWWLRAIDWESVLGKSGDSQDDEWVTDLLMGDTFLNLRLMDLLLPPKANPTSDEEGDFKAKMIEWGSLQYQSLMLERTLAMSALVSSLVTSQRVETEDRIQEEGRERKRRENWDWEKGIFVETEWTGVKGVLLVDNDAVWLSSPSAHLDHPYRRDGTHPSMIFAPDIPPHSTNAWGTHQMPCACFIYSRTSSHLSHTAFGLSLDERDEYRSAEGAAHAWKTTALCHISVLLHTLGEAREQAARFYGTELNYSQSIEDLVRAKAPSFQATALGPALYLEELELEILPRIKHEDWMEALGSGRVEDMEKILQEAGFQEGGTTCLELAQRNHHITPNLYLHTSLTNPSGRARGIRTEALPYGLFPPGRSFFHEQREEAGTKPCVVHANYAVGGEKERLLRREGLWALGGDEEVGWTCDKEIMERA